MEDRNVDKSITDVLERSYRILRLADGNMKTNEECGLIQDTKGYGDVCKGCNRLHRTCVEVSRSQPQGFGD